MASSPSPSWLFHKLVVQLSTSGTPFSVDRLAYLCCPSCVQKMLRNHPAIFLRQGSCYTIKARSNNTILLATYLSLSCNVSEISTKQNIKLFSQFPTVMIKSNSTNFSSISSILPDQTSPLVIYLPNGSSYQLDCSLKEDSGYSLVAGCQLLANIKFAVNSCQQLMCMVINLSKKESSTGKMITQSTNYSYQSHIPLWKGEEGGKEMRSRVFVRSDLRSKGRQVDSSELQQQELVFKVWMLMIEMGLEYSGEGSIEEIAKKLVTKGQAVDEKQVLEVLAQYRDLFTVSVSGLQISLQPASHSFWSQMLLLCSNVTLTTGLDHVPISTAKLGVTLGNNMVVLRYLQGMALPSNTENVFMVTFRFCETGQGFLVQMNNSKMKVPAEGKVIPLTLVMQALPWAVARRGVMVVPSLGSWEEFKVNWPKTDVSFRVENNLTDDLELLLDVGQQLSSAISDSDIVTLDEEN